jgi:peroxiredoxin
MHAYRDQYAQVFNNGQDVVLIAISNDTVEDLFSWAKDDQFQFLMASDRELNVAKAYGAFDADRQRLSSRNLFVVGPDGKIAYRAIPFREIDPTAYTDLAAAVKKLVPPAGDDQKH